MTRQEAREAIHHCHKLRKSIDRLLVKAMKALRPELRVVSDTVKGEQCGILDKHTV